MTRRTTGTVLDGTGDLWTDGLLLAAAGATVLAAAGLVVWVAGACLSWVTGNGSGPNPVDAAARLLERDGGLAAIWPGVPLGAVLGLAVLLAAAVVVLMTVAAGRWTAAHPPRDGFARTPQLAEVLAGRDAVRRARRLRPSLAGTRAPRPSDLGVPLGRLERRGRPVRASWEDVVLAICAPRAGKTTSLAIPAVLDAPGAVVATSNKADLWQHTAPLRAADTGQPVWTFDPQAVTGTEQGFVWSALDGVTTVAAARRLAGHFIQEVRRTTDTADFWDRDAEDLLTALLLAAALDRQPLAQVGVWLTAVSSVEPRNILTRSGFTQLAQVMAGRSQGAHETREGVYATARAASACLSDPQIMAWVTPRPGRPVFDPAAFVRSRQTLYLLSKDGAGSAAPLVAAFADRIIADAVAAAERSPGGRLDPPLVAVLDEAANICRITELPRLYSHLGSRGVVPLTILQSRAQGRRVWGDAGMDELFSAATLKLIGAGIDDPAFADDISRLIGDEDIRVTTRTPGKNGGTSTTTRRERVLPPDEVRALPKHTALLLLTGVRPARMRLVPWMDGARAGDIRAALGRTP